jgi:hypothetical protein
VNVESGQVIEWRPVTYRQVQGNVELSARYWTQTLDADGIPRGSVVGLW